VEWLQRVRATGSVRPAKIGGYVRPLLEGEREWILARFAEAGCDLTVRSLAAELTERGVKTGPYAVWAFFKREGLTFKKKPARGRAGAAGRGAPAGPLAAPSEEA